MFLTVTNALAYRNAVFTAVKSFVVLSLLFASSILGRHKDIFLPWGLYYKYFYGRNLRISVLS
jgi:hypothetical protein